jgi:hypothetical protein
VLLRDPRAWHGGTPNLSRHVRFLGGAGASLHVEDAPLCGRVALLAVGR